MWCFYHKMHDSLIFGHLAAGLMAPRDQRSQRKQWRERQNNCRRASNQMTTPPPSPDGEIGQIARGRKRVALNRAKCYRKVRKLESDIDDEKRKTDR